MNTIGSRRRPLRLSQVLLSVVAMLLCSSQVHSQPRYRPELKPYVEFLDHQKTSAKDYILGLFKDHDLVILCERHHQDITQYDLFLSIVSDRRFTDSVGNVFTEIGTSTQGREVNAFVHAEGLPADSVDQAVLRFQRNCSFYPLWENYNYSYFLRGLYALNQKLPNDKKVSLFNSDVPFDWSTISEAQLKKLWDQVGMTRDSIIAFQIMQRFDEIRMSHERRHKALVIVNYRHAFRHDLLNPSGVKRANAGRYLFERYGDRVANVFISGLSLLSARSDNDVSVGAIQDGKWDAAFKAGNARDLGFDFKGSPFGKDAFDIWPVKTGLTFQDEFTGFAFYLPLEEYKLVRGMPGLIDSTFGVELLRRYALYSTLPGGRWKPLTDIEGEKREMNNKRQTPLDELDSLTAQIRKWLQE